MAIHLHPSYFPVVVPFIRVLAIPARDAAGGAAESTGSKISGALLLERVDLAPFPARLRLHGPGFSRFLHLYHGRLAVPYETSGPARDAIPVAVRPDGRSYGGRRLDFRLLCRKDFGQPHHPDRIQCRRSGRSRQCAAQSVSAADGAVDDSAPRNLCRGDVDCHAKPDSVHAGAFPVKAGTGCFLPGIYLAGRQLRRFRIRSADLGNYDDPCAHGVNDAHCRRAHAGAVFRHGEAVSAAELKTGHGFTRIRNFFHAIPLQDRSPAQPRRNVAAHSVLSGERP